MWERYEHLPLREPMRQKTKLLREGTSLALLNNGSQTSEPHDGELYFVSSKVWKDSMAKGRSFPYAVIRVTPGQHRILALKGQSCRTVAASWRPLYSPVTPDHENGLKEETCFLLRLVELRRVSLQTEGRLGQLSPNDYERLQIKVIG